VLALEGLLADVRVTESWSGTHLLGLVVLAGVVVGLLLAVFVARRR